MRLLAGLALLGATFFGAQELRQQHHRGGLDAIASEIAGRGVHVACQDSLSRALDLSANAGSVHFDAQGRPSDSAELKGGTCDDLAAYPDRRADSHFSCVFSPLPCPLELERTVLSVLVLTHESEHLAGIRPEAEAQCRAVQQMSLVAERLGSPPAEARAIAYHFFVVQQPRVDPAYRLAPECSDGGDLDLDPRVGWPSP